MNVFSYGMSGVGVVVQSPGDVVEVTRVGWGAEITGKPAPDPNSISWFHFPINTLYYVGGGSCPTVKAISILFKTGGTAKITNVHVWLGGQRIWALDGLTIIGNHLLPDKDNWIEGPKFDPHLPVNVCVGVHFGPLEGKISPSILLQGVSFTCDLD